ncbi:MAG: hypothetical protein N2652_07810 [Kiritimatiellae bacterium]|nr:hypothetical protein [Kiritimatiellia bacterium]
MSRRIPWELLRRAPSGPRPAPEFWAEFRGRVGDVQRVESVWVVRPLPVAIAAALVVAATLLLAPLGVGPAAQAAGVRLDVLEINVPHLGVMVLHDPATSGIVVAIDGLDAAGGEP